MLYEVITPAYQAPQGQLQQARSHPAARGLRQTVCRRPGLARIARQADVTGAEEIEMQARQGRARRVPGATRQHGAGTARPQADS